jgi:hypothetical protein
MTTAARLEALANEMMVDIALGEHAAYTCGLTSRTGTVPASFRYRADSMRLRNHFHPLIGDRMTQHYSPICCNR